MEMEFELAINLLKFSQPNPLYSELTWTSLIYPISGENLLLIQAQLGSYVKIIGLNK